MNPRSPSCLPRQAGFTLVELMFTITIAAILMVIAVPSFIAYQRNSELTGAANGLLASAAAARTEAMKRNLPALVVPLGSGWASGWRSFVDVDRNGSYGGTDILVASQRAMPAYFSVTGAGTAAGSAPFLRFDGSGYSAWANVAFARTDVTGAALFAQTRYVVLALTGRVRVCKPVSATDPACSASSNF
jgi:type IV fimbrial biogenesis protein FimT